MWSVICVLVYVSFWLVTQRKKKIWGVSSLFQQWGEKGGLDPKKELFLHCR